MDKDFKKPKKFKIPGKKEEGHFVRPGVYIREIDISEVVVNNNAYNAPLHPPPQYMRRIILEIRNEEWEVSISSLPSYEIRHEELHDVTGISRYVALARSWNPIEINVINNLTMGAFRGSRLEHWLTQTFQNGTYEPRHINDLTESITLKMYQPDGTVINMWRLDGCLLTASEFGDMRYDGDVEVSFTINYQRAINLR